MAARHVITGFLIAAKKRMVPRNLPTCLLTEFGSVNSKTATAVFMFDCFHDMVDPQGAAKQAFKALKPDGVVVLIEPLAADEPGLENALSVPVSWSCICHDWDCNSTNVY